MVSDPIVSSGHETGDFEVTSCLKTLSYHHLPMDLVINLCFGHEYANSVKC